MWANIFSPRIGADFRGVSPKWFAASGLAPAAISISTIALLLSLSPLAVPRSLAAVRSAVWPDRKYRDFVSARTESLPRFPPATPTKRPNVGRSSHIRPVRRAARLRSHVATHPGWAGDANSDSCRATPSGMVLSASPLLLPSAVLNVSERSPIHNIDQFFDSVSRLTQRGRCVWAKCKSTFLQHPNRGDIVFCDVGVQWSIGDKAKNGDSIRVATPFPNGLSRSSTPLALTILRPTTDVAGNAPVDDNRHRHAALIAQNL